MADTAALKSFTDIPILDWETMEGDETSYDVFRKLRETTPVDPATVRRLTREAVALNAALGNPAQAGK